MSLENGILNKYIVYCRCPQSPPGIVNVDVKNRVTQDPCLRVLDGIPVLNISRMEDKGLSIYFLTYCTANLNCSLSVELLLVRLWPLFRKLFDF